MAVTGESLANFQRGIIGDSFLVVYGTLTRETHFGIAERRDGAAVPPTRQSNIGGVLRAVLGAAGGHAQIANWAGIQAIQVAGGVAQGSAAGCSIRKTGARTWEVDTLRSGFNTQFAVATNPRHPGTPPAELLRTLPMAYVQVIQNEITGGMQTIMNLTDDPDDAMEI